jgi:hypothetical protein
MSVAAAGISLLYHYASHNGFSNDHFIHLARAQAMLAGDWPIRDYVEEGVPLTVLLSAGAQRVLGESPWAELVMTTGAMAVAAGVTCWLTAAFTRSALAGLFAALLQALARPRLYSYPKIVLYPVLMLLAWRYLDRPSRGRLAALAGFVVVAFLMRHDHGVYTGLGAAAAVAVGNWRHGVPTMARRLGELVLVGVVFASPYLAYVQYQSGLVPYFQNGIAISRTEAARTSGVHADFDPLPAGRWLELDEGIAVGPRLAAVLRPRYQAVVLYWFAWCLPLLAVAWVLAGGRSGRGTLTQPLLALTALVLVTRLGLFRESLEIRASDVYGVFPILALWALVTTWRWRLPQVALRVVARAAVSVVVLGLFLATGLVGDAVNAFPRTELMGGPTAVLQRIGDVSEDARTYPWARQWPAGSGWRVARYVRDCTAPTDRLLVTWNKPEMYVWAQRPFASGETLLVPALRPPEMFAARALERLRGQSVPIVLVQPSTYAEDFLRLYPDIAAFIDTRYTRVGHFGNDDRDDVDVYVAKDRAPTGVDPEFQWPCFR